MLSPSCKAVALAWLVGSDSSDGVVCLARYETAQSELGAGNLAVVGDVPHSLKQGDLYASRLRQTRESGSTP